MLAPHWRADSPRGPVFDHHLMAHGRILYRFPGSEACRFSPQLAYRLLARLAREVNAPATLWDPFCGTGLIPAVAGAFFAHRYRVLLASDVLPAAAACARANLRLWWDPLVQQQRLAELARAMRPSPRHAQRWGAVRTYLTTLLATPSPVPTATHAWTGAAQHAPQVLDRPLVLIGDLPYGAASHLAGADEAGCLGPLLAAHPHAHALWVLRVARLPGLLALAAQLARTAGVLPVAGGRVAVRLLPTGVPLPEPWAPAARAEMISGRGGRVGASVG